MDEKFERQLKDSRYLRRPMKPDTEYAGETRWVQKPALKSRILPLTENFDKLSMSGPGAFSVDLTNTVSGNGSVRIETPHQIPVKNPSNRAYAGASVTYPLDRENITEYNRLSVYMYLDSPGHPNAFISIALNNAGEHIMPAPGRYEGSHHITMTPGEWRRIVWEFPTIYRDCCTGFTVTLSLSGAQQRGGNTMSLYLDDMRLETVEPENSLGYDLRKDALAYCHSGYRAEDVKQALIQNSDADSFTVKDPSGREVFSGEAKGLEQGFKLLDFSDIKEPGYYTVHAGGISSMPFPIGDDAYRSAAWRILNFIFSERCGFDVPGIHTECHQDALCAHPADGRKITVCGGWHDAADLTQDTCNTIDVAWSVMDLAEAYKEKDGILYERALEEARWGLNWIMRTRFGDGYRHNGMVIGIWTNNMIGDFDDMTAAASNPPFTNFAAAGVCAKAAQIDWEDPLFTKWCLDCAVEDFDFGKQFMHVPNQKNPEIALYGQATVAAVMLYKATKQQNYLDGAADFARVILSCQEQRQREDLKNIRGFFYETRECKRILAYFHRSYEHLPVQALALLSETAPGHKDAANWKYGMELYAGYLKATLVPPYDLLASSIYEVDNTDYSSIYHEGSRAIGQPSMEEYNRQVRNGRKLSDQFYLRTFPAAYQFRGFHATLLSKAKAAAILSKTLGDAKLQYIAARQGEWILGMNPFAVSTVYGEGYDYALLYGALLGDVMGAVPVGIETFEDLDLPYFPMQVNCTYKEVWVHAAARLMWLIAEPD